MTFSLPQVQKLLPLIAVSVSRGGQLVLLLAIAKIAPQDASDFAVATVGVLAAGSIVFDGGGSNYLLTRQAKPTRPQYSRALLLQSFIALPGYTIVLCWQASRAPVDLSGLWWIAVLAFALGQMLDSLLRIARSPRLARGEDKSYAVPDLLSGGARLVLAYISLTMGSLSPSLAAPLVTATILLAVILAERGQSENVGPTPRVRDVLSFGAGSALSALYSQMPMIVGTVVLSWSDAARLALAYRFTQPLEMIPATISTQALPRLVRRPSLLTPLVACMFALGVIVALLLIAGQALLFSVVGLPDQAGPVFALIALALIPKFANYSLVAAINAFGGAFARIWTNVVLGIFVSALAVALGSSYGVMGISASTLSAELLLLCVSIMVARHFRASERMNGNEDLGRELGPVGNRG